MSGVAKDETNSPSTTDDPATATPDGMSVPEGQGASHPPESDIASPDPTLSDPHGADLKSGDHKAGRRPPHLRVVADNDSPVDPSTPGPAAQRIGAVMRAQRQALGYDLDSVSKETRIAVSHLRAIEDMTPNMIGQPVYVKGHIRTYARHLKMDPDAVLAQYKDECALLADPEKQDIAPPVTTRKLPAAIPVFGLLVVALIIAGGAFIVIQAGGGSASKAGAANPDQATAAAAGALNAPIAPPLHIVAVKEARIEVRGADGTKFLARVFEPGESYSPRVGAGWTVTTSDGAAFEWRLGDQSLGLLAPEGPVYAQSVDLAVKREPVAPPAAPVGATEPSPLDANARAPVDAQPPAAPAVPSADRSPAVRPTTPTVSALPPATKPRPRPAAKTVQPPAAQATAPAPAQVPAQVQVRTPPQIGTAPVPTAAPAANPTPVTDPSLLAYPPPG